MAHKQGNPNKIGRMGTKVGRRVSYMRKAVKKHGGIATLQPLSFPPLLGIKGSQ